MLYSFLGLTARPSSKRAGLATTTTNKIYSNKRCSKLWRPTWSLNLSKILRFRRKSNHPDDSNSAKQNGDLKGSAKGDSALGSVPDLDFAISQVPNEAQGSLPHESQLPSDEPTTLVGTKSEVTAKAAMTKEQADPAQAENLDRRDFKTIAAIPNDKFELILKSALAKNPKMREQSLASVMKRGEGSYNHVVSLIYLNSTMKTVKSYVIKVPAHAVEPTWTDDDSHTQLSEIRLLQYLHEKTNIPVPKIVSWDDTFWNPIGAPYMIMEQLPGETAENIWYDDPSGDGADIFRNADVPSQETEQKRTNFIRSLAGYMAKLDKLQFDKIGCFQLPDFRYGDMGEPSIVHGYRWYDRRSFHEPMRYDAIASSHDYFQNEMDYLSAEWEKIAMEKATSPGELAYAQAGFRGLRTVLNIIFSQPMFTPTENETFVLRHPDLDLQNILTDKEGNVTGILDWDGCITAPRCIGYASMPTFLRRDWLCDAEFEINREVHVSWRSNYYRQLYAKSMKATGCSDAKYTANSVYYQAAAGVLHDRWNPDEFVKKFLLQIPGFQMGNDTLEDFLNHLGRGWPSAEQYLRHSIELLLDPDRVSPWDAFVEAANEDLSFTGSTTVSTNPESTTKHSPLHECIDAVDDQSEDAIKSSVVTLEMQHPRCIDCIIS